MACIDVETSGLDWKRNHIVGYVLTFGPRPEDSYYYPVRHAGGGNILGMPGPQEKEGWNGKVNDIDKAIVSGLNGCRLIFGHNMSFDLKFLSRVGLDLDGPQIEDTIINAPLIDEWCGRYSLEACCDRAKVAAKKGAVMKAHILKLFPETKESEAMGSYWRLSGADPVAVEYAEGDGTSTWQLRDWQNEELGRQDLTLVHEVESRLIPVLARMSIHGIRIDEEELESSIKKVGGQIDQLMSKFPADFNPKSPQDVQKWCQDHGQTDWPLTAKKALPSFPEKWLKTHEAGQQIVKARQLFTLQNSFLLPMRDRHLFKGRVHTEYHQLRNDEFGTVTGRLSCTDPNLQAVTKRNRETGMVHRAIFIPDKGKRWASADYAQCEPVLLAVYSRCKVLIDGYNADPPIDAHAAVTRAINPGWEKMSKEEFKAARETGKRINQTLLTGGGAGVLTEKYGVPPNQARQAMANYFARMPEIKSLQKKASLVMKKRGFVLSLLGRRARLNDPNKSYTAMNRLLQCGNADIIKTKLVEIDEYLKSVGRPVQVLNNIHDDLSFQFRPSERKHYEECLRIMSDFGPGNVIRLDVPLRVDPGEGKNWAEATFGGE